MIASLPTALLLSALGSAVLAATLLYLSRFETRRGPGWWAAAMGVNFLRQVLNYVAATYGFIWAAVGFEIVYACSATMFLIGALYFKERQRYARFAYTALAAAIAWDLGAFWLDAGPLLRSAPVFAFAGLIAIAAGAALALGRRGDLEGGETFVSVLLVIAGVNSIIYPFVSDVGLMPWRLVVTNGIGLGVALGLIIVILRRQAAALSAATRRADTTLASLAQSELRFRDFAEVSSDWLWETGPDLRFTYLSENFERAFGATREATLGRRAEDIRRVSVDSPAWDRHLADLAAHRPFQNFHFIYRPQEGQRRNLVVNGKPIFDAAGAFLGYRGAGRDETETVQTIERESQSRQRLLEAFQTMPSAVALYDPQDRLLICNEAYHAVLGPAGAAAAVPGAPYETVLRAAVTDAMLPRGETLEPMIARRLAQHHAAAAEPMEVERPDGRWLLTYDHRLKDGSIVVVITDVTATKHSETELAQKSALMQSAIENMGEGIAVFDGDLRLQMWNQRRIEIGAVPTEFYTVGARLEDMVRYRAERGEYGPADVETVVRERFDPVRMQTPHRSARWTLDGRYIMTRRNPMPGGGVIMVMSDLTDSKRSEDALREAKETAETANRTKSEILANMSHELRTPLNAIIGFSEIILREAFGPVGQKRYLDYANDIYESGTHLLALINDILDVSKAEAGRIELLEGLVDITELFDSCVRLVRPRAEEAGVKLIVAPAGAAPKLQGDNLRLKQVLLNLLSNAVKFTPTGGRVTLDTIRGVGGAVVIRVSDTGIGMSPEDIPKALSPFGQLENSLARNHAGTGLGLPLSKALVELHGGQLQIDSEKGRGTTVAIVLPASRVLLA